MSSWGGNLTQYWIYSGGGILRALSHSFNLISKRIRFHRSQIIKDVLYKIELFDELQNEVAETRTDNERLQQIISERDEELSESSEAIRKLQTERESLKRQLEDLQVIFFKERN